MKVDCRKYKGIEYVMLQELPQTQQEKLEQTCGRDSFIKILIDGKIVSQCIQYKEYSVWYDTIYKTRVSPLKENRMPEPLTVNPQLV